MSKNAKLNLKEKLDDENLDLSVCELETVPVKEIIDLGKAKKLNLSYNLLKRLPDDFFKLSMIRELDLSKNRLTCLPKNFGQMQSLRSLDLLGNELVSLPSSFCELKNLQWLDLKNNPLELSLKQAAGDCLNEAQCKKCALNVIRYVKQQASDEERERQLLLKQKKEEQLKKAALEKEQEEKLRQEQKLLKQQEREQRRIFNEARKLERENQEKQNNSNGSTSKHDTSRTKAGKHEKKNKLGGFLKSFLFILFVVSTLAFFMYVLLENYCVNVKVKPESLRYLTTNQYLQPLFKVVNEEACVRIENKTSISENILNYLHFIKI